MRLADVIDHATDHARFLKAERVREFRREEEQWVANRFVCYRGETPVAVIIPDQAGGTPEMLRSVTIAAGGFEADVVVFIMDTFSLGGPLARQWPLLNPITGQPFVDGDLQRLVEHHQGREQGWVVDSLSLHAFNRAGDTHTRQLDYEVRHRTKLVWGEVKDMPIDDPRVVARAGLLHKGMAKVMQTPTLGVLTHTNLQLKMLSSGWSEEKRRAHMDCGIMRALLERDASGLLWTPTGTERAEVIYRSFPDMETLSDDN